MQNFIKISRLNHDHYAVVRSHFILELGPFPANQLVDFTYLASLLMFLFLYHTVEVPYTTFICVTLNGCTKSVQVNLIDKKKALSLLSFHQSGGGLPHTLVLNSQRVLIDCIYFSATLLVSLYLLREKNAMHNLD